MTDSRSALIAKRPLRFYHQIRLTLHGSEILGSFKRTLRSQSHNCNIGSRTRRYPWELRADELAGIAASTVPCGPEPIMGLLKFIIRSLIMIQNHSKFESYWNNDVGCRHFAFLSLTNIWYDCEEGGSGLWTLWRTWGIGRTLSMPMRYSHEIEVLAS